MPLAVAEAFIRDAVSLRAGGSRERVLIENFVSRLRGMFPQDPAWVTAHIRDAEAQVAYAEGSLQRRAFVDNLVGYTTIEYEHDLRKRPIFDTGYEQVRQHVAGMLNAGVAPAKILGVLSDTVQWRVYRIESIACTQATALAPEDVRLEEVERLDLSGLATGDPERLTDFLSRHLGRDGAHLLAAETVARDLGFDSPFGAQHVVGMTAVVEDALAARPEYADIIRDLWSEFAGYVGGQITGTFDPAMYVNELYALTLAKLLCANVLAGHALHSDDRELHAILGGGFFRAKGLDNLVEYDYFGWLNAEPYVQQLIPVAEDMQRGLRSFDFGAPAAEDLFGRLMAQLADRSQRLLLGQESTPPWLAERLARELVFALSDDERPRFLDMCCGSGSTIVEVVKLAKANPPRDGHDAVDELVQAATGFDIDPLAVMLAKVNWVVAVRDRLGPLDGSRRISIPIYHADSMFAKTPIGKLHGAAGDSYRLTLNKHVVELPSFLVTPERGALFDAVLEVAYRVAMQAAKEPVGALTAVDIDAALDEALRAAADTLSGKQQDSVRTLLEQLVDALERLQRADLNGIWAFILRNGYRPGLLAGQFNGLITNPPWLALSKLADNPYQQTLQGDAAAYGIQPSGAAHLHTELATTFLLHAVDRYLADGAVVGCILPETVLNGYHHELFRRGAYSTSTTPVDLRVHELWRVARGTFKNEAIVLIGEKKPVEKRDGFPGLVVREQGDQPISFQVTQLAAGLRTAWSDSGEGARAGWFDELEFRQGADLMPRTGVFHEVRAARGGQIQIAPIDTATSPNAYLMSDGKRIKDFRITATTVPRYLVYDALISKHLVHFELAGPAQALLPFERTADGKWRPVTNIKLATSPTAQAVFAEICDAVSAETGKSFTLAHYQAKLDTRHKLVAQRAVDDRGFLVVYGAGGGLIAAAFAPLTRFDVGRLVIDQTLYSLIVDSEDEAVYTTGLFNSRAIDTLINEFKPRGAFGGRHLHKLPTTVTPAYDSAQALHTAVVDATRRLLADFAAARQDPTVREWFNPNRNLAWRRRMIRERIIHGLPSHRAYAEACAALYAL